MDKLNISALLKKLNWTTTDFLEKSGVKRRTAYDIVNEKYSETSSVKLARKWLEAEVKNRDGA